MLRPYNIIRSIAYSMGMQRNFHQMEQFPARHIEPLQWLIINRYVNDLTIIRLIIYENEIQK